MIRNIIKLLRPKHWIKNLLVFAALIFSFNFYQEEFIKTAWAFISFSIFASIIYIFNDILDHKRDRLHPLKKNRPIASGRIKIWQALLLALILLPLAMYIALAVGNSFAYVCLVYFAINIVYSLGLKHLAIIDVMIVALGFVLRVMAGAYAIKVPISHWILLCTFFISLFMAFGKRKNEMDTLSTHSSSRHRKSISEYTNGFMDQMLAITAGISVVFYSLYTIDASTIQRFGNDNLIYTTPIVVFTILRYFYLLYNEKKGGDPVAIFIGDGQMITAVIVWILSVVSIHQFL